MSAARLHAAEPELVREPELVLDPVVVTANRYPRPIAQVPASLSLLDSSQIREARPTITLDESLNSIPGVFVQNAGNFAQDQRLQIRGFGTRAAFGVRELRVLVDGLPETLPDGQTELDGVDLGMVERIEVLRGPASALYGNASGGVVQLFTDEPPEHGGTGEVRVTGGELGLAKVLLKGGGRFEKTGLAVQTSFTRVDGYRHHSGARSFVLNGKLRRQLGETGDLTFLFQGVDAPKADDPGALTREQVDANRRQAQTLNQVLDAGEEVGQVRLGSVLNQAIGPGELSGYGFLLYRDFAGRLPIPADRGDGIVTVRRVSPGGGIRYLVPGELLALKQELVAGVDAQHQADQRRRFANLDGTRGQLGLEQEESVTSVGAYLRDDVALTERFSVAGGARFDAVRFGVDADFPSSPNPGSSMLGGADDKRTLTAWSPSAAILYRGSTGIAFLNFGTAFQVPTTTELANPDGPGFNSALEPQLARTIELGSRLSSGGRLSAGVAGFVIDLEDELVPFESPSGRTFFRNAARSRRYGFELDAQLELDRGWHWRAAVSFLDARFRDYSRDSTAAGSFDGNREPGIPPWHIYQELSYRHPSGLFAALELSFVDGFFVDDANTARTPGYVLLNLRCAYPHAIAGLRVTPFLGLNNLLDADYDGTVRLNAQGGRHFEPTPGFNAYGGVTVELNLS